MAIESTVNPGGGAAVSVRTANDAPAPAGQATAAPVRGLSFRRLFTTPGVDPFDAVEWELRDAVIGNEQGEKVFEQKGVEVPKFWSQTATNVVVSKYFRGTSAPRSASARCASSSGAWSTPSPAGGGRAATSPPTRTRAPSTPSSSTSCFTSTPASTRRSGSTSASRRSRSARPASSTRSRTPWSRSSSSRKTEGMLFKYGSGTGSNLSTLRSSREQLAGGGTASGPVSFMRGFDAFAGVIKSGGKTRRAAKMVILNVDHPDIVDFIRCKEVEEKKAWALIDAGYDGGFNVTGGAYDSISYQNANHSVRVTDEFMEAVAEDGDWTTRAVTDGHVMETYKARDLMRMIAESTWVCGDPGMQYDTTINDWHTCADDGAHQRLEPVLRVHVPRRHGLQPGVAQPDEVPRRRARLRRRELPPRLRGGDLGAGDHRRQRQLPDAADRRELARLPPARARLRQPRRAAHGARPALRLRRRPRLRGGDHRADVRRLLRPVGAHRREARAVRRLREEPRADAAGHAQAPRRGAAASTPRTCRSTCCRPRKQCWDEVVETRRPVTASATARSRCSRRPAPSPS